MALLRDIVNERRYKLDLIGVGGIATHADVAQRLAAGASHVQLATAAMIDPLAAIAIRAAALRND